MIGGSDSIIGGSESIMRDLDSVGSDSENGARTEAARNLASVTRGVGRIG